MTEQQFPVTDPLDAPDKQEPGELPEPAIDNPDADDGEPDEEGAEDA